MVQVRNLLLFFVLFFNLLFIQGISGQKLDKVSIIKDYEKQVATYRAAGNIASASLYLTKIAFIYWDAGDLDKAEEYFLSAAEINPINSSPESLKKIYTNLAIVYTDKTKYKEALQYFNKSLVIRRSLNNSSDISAGINDVAYVLVIQRQFEQAIPLLQESLKLALKINNSSLILNCYDLLSHCYKGIGNRKENEFYQAKFTELTIIIQNKKQQELQKEKEAKQFVEADKSKAELQEKELILELSNLRSKAVEDSMMRETQKARDSVAVVSKQKEIAEKLSLKQKELTNALSLKQEAEQKRQEILLYGAAAVFVLFILLLGVGFWSYMNKRKDNRILEKNNAEIKNQAEALNKKNLELSVALKQNEYQTKNIEKSISYASRIQLSLLPEMDKLQTILPESFIFFQPRDVVSGDFYWFKETYNTKVDTSDFSDSDDINSNLKLVEEKAIIISAVDCSGHGVPGALLSMIGINHLEDIVNHKRIIEPGEILNNLHLGIRNSLKQETNMGRDGMDIALCTIYTESNMVEFAGAKNPAIYVKNGQLHRIKGEVYSIGGFQLSDEQLYSTHRIEIDQPVMFYVFSDGFGDQFGGPSGKKFMTNNFRDFLLTISDLPINEQQAKMENTFDEWKGGLEQVDDVLVIGFKVYPNNWKN